MFLFDLSNDSFGGITRGLQLEMMDLASFIVVYVLLVFMSMKLRLGGISLANRTLHSFRY